MSEPTPDQLFANLYASSILHVVALLPQQPSIGVAEALSRLEARIVFLMRDQTWSARISRS